MEFWLLINWNTHVCAHSVSESTAQEEQWCGMCCLLPCILLWDTSEIRVTAVGREAQTLFLRGEMGD